MKKASLTVLMLSFVLVVSMSALADTLTTSLGNTASGFTDGTKVTSASAVAAQSGQSAPFNGPCGSDVSANCSTNWTFNYGALTGDTLNSATITLGIYDIDSNASGNQVASYTLTGGDDLTAALNALSESAASLNSYYNVFMVTIPTTSFVQLASGTAQFNLALAGPGLGTLGSSTYNGASLIYSTLSIDYTPNSTPPVPEPSSAVLLLGGVATLWCKRGLLRR